MATALPAAAVSSVGLQTQLDEDMRALVDNFEGLLRAAQARHARAVRPAPPQTLNRGLAAAASAG